MMALQCAAECVQAQVSACRLAQQIGQDAEGRQEQQKPTGITLSNHQTVCVRCWLPVKPLSPVLMMVMFDQCQIRKGSVIPAHNQHERTTKAETVETRAACCRHLKWKHPGCATRQAGPVTDEGSAHYLLQAANWEASHMDCSNTNRHPVLRKLQHETTKPAPTQGRL